MSKATLCPNKNLASWKALVNGIKDKYKISAELAEVKAEVQFHKIDNIPSLADAIASIEKGNREYAKGVIKEFIDGALKGVGSEAKMAKEGFGEGFAIGIKLQKNASEKDAEKRFKEDERLRNEFAGLVSAYLNSKAKLKGVLSPKKIDSIVRRATKIGYSEEAFNEFADYVDKVIDDANYDALLSQAKDIRGKLSKGFANTLDILHRIKALPIKKLLGEELERYIEVATNYVNGVKNANNRGYRVFNVEKNSAILSEIEEKLEEREFLQRMEEQRNPPLLGLPASTSESEELTEEEEDYLDSLEEGNEGELEVDKVENLRRKLKRRLDIAHGRFLEGAYHLMQSTNDEYVNRFIKEIIHADIDSVNGLLQLNEAIKILDNIAENKTIASVGRAWAIIVGSANAKEAEEFFKDTHFNGYNKLMNSFSQFPVALRWQFMSTENAAEIRRLSGYNDVALAGSMADAIGKEINKRYHEFLRSRKIENTPNFDITVGMLMHLMNIDKGSPEAFSDAKVQIEESINAFAAETNQPWEIEFSDTIDLIYRNYFQEATTIDEAIDALNKDYISKDVVAAASFFQEEYKKIAKKYQAFAMAVAGKAIDIDKYIAYSRKNYLKVGDGRADVAEPDALPDDILFTTSKPSETGSADSRKLKRTLPVGMALDFRAEYASIKSLTGAYFEMDAYAPKMLHVQFSKSANQLTVFGSSRAAFNDEFDTQYKLWRFGNRNYDALASSLLVKASRAVRNASTAIALGDAVMIHEPFLKQKVVYLNALMHAPDYIWKLIKVRNVNKIALLKLATIGYRKEEMGVYGASETIKNSSLSGYGARDIISKMFDGAGEVTKKLREISMWSLVKSDVDAAQTTFLAFYMQKMEQLGEKISVEMLATEHKRLNDNRYKAIAFAQQRVDELQGVSSKVQQSSFARGDNGGVTQELARGVTMPFSNFALNARTRLTTDFRQLLKGNRSQKNAAMLGIAAFTVETLTFHVVSKGVKFFTAAALAPVVYWMLGVDDEDEITAEEIDKVFTTAWRAGLVDLVSSGLGSHAERAMSNMVLPYIHFILSGTESTFDDFKKEKGYFDPTFYAEKEAVTAGDKIIKATIDMGAYKPFFEAGANVIDATHSLATNEMRLETGVWTKDTEKNGKETHIGPSYSAKEVEMDDKDRNIAMAKTLLHGLALAGYNAKALKASVDKIDRKNSKLNTKPRGKGRGQGKL